MGIFASKFRVKLSTDNETITSNKHSSSWNYRVYQSRNVERSEPSRMDSNPSKVSSNSTDYIFTTNHLLENINEHNLLVKYVSSHLKSIADRTPVLFQALYLLMRSVVGCECGDCHGMFEIPRYVRK